MSSSEKCTDKQKKCIMDMIEFSPYNLPFIDLNTATKQECSDFIDKYGKLAHESLWAINSGYE